MDSQLQLGLARPRYRPLPQDFIVALLAAIFALLSFAFPDTGPAGPQGLARGYLVGAAFLAVAALSLLFPFVPEEAPSALAFVRLFFPQALLVLFFQESILLSVELFRGRAFDAVIANADYTLFGFQPSRWFHRAFDRFPAFNETMFGSYFLYYVFFGVTPWIPFLSGRRRDAERCMFVVVSMMAVIFLFYLFFRVEGPKYWFSDLRETAYGQFSGGFFVRFFQRIFRSTPLYGAAFPSTHVAFSLLMTIFAFRTDRRLLWIYLPGMVLIDCSTIYLYAHYFTDVIGGLAATLILEPLLWRAYPRILEALRPVRRPSI
ncbi:MAG TPA: phosphatase PAP2 family protein [Rectinemataceae bacterium]|nr:phosphatase PAP2 family protein [Rectinemataceae bacterium]